MYKKKKSYRNAIVLLRRNDKLTPKNPFLAVVGKPNTMLRKQNILGAKNGCIFSKIATNHTHPARLQNACPSIGVVSVSANGPSGPRRSPEIVSVSDVTATPAAAHVFDGTRHRRHTSSAAHVFGGRKPAGTGRSRLRAPVAARTNASGDRSKGPARVPSGARLTRKCNNNRQRCMSRRPQTRGKKKPVPTDRQTDWPRDTRRALTYIRSYTRDTLVRSKSGPCL